VGAVVALSNIPATAADQVESAASATLPANSVTSATVVNGSLYQQDINPTVVGVLRTPKQNSVTGWSIKDGTVGFSDLTPSVQGLVAVGRLTNLAVVSTIWTWTGDGGVGFKEATTRCPVGKIAVGGGYWRDSGDLIAMKGIQVITSTVIQVNVPEPNAWVVEGFNNSTHDVNIKVSVACANLSK
jgi:hypothetical protein